MLKNLHINNYALIQQIDLDFGKGLTIITGETGAGKSILLGGLELIRGKRAQQGLLKNIAQKSIVEAVFYVKDTPLKALFEKEDLDYDDESIFRRELLPNGKSRAFINDTPVRLEHLQKLTDPLIDIHSQHQILALNQKKFQFEFIDAVANNHELLHTYSVNYVQYTSLKLALKLLEENLVNAAQELDYKSFQLKELHEIKLQEINPVELEQRFKTIENSEEIKYHLAESFNKIDQEELGILQQIIRIKNGFTKFKGIAGIFYDLENRFESIQVELQDLLTEISDLTDSVAYDPSEKERLQIVFDKLNLLLLKHHADNIEDLIVLQNKLETEVNDLSSLELQIEDKRNELVKVEKKLDELSDKIHRNRVQAMPGLLKQVSDILNRLSMQNTLLKIDITPEKTFLSNGKDILQFHISSDAGKTFGDIKRIASGGELSRLMLAIKTILSKYKNLPTIIFDEIDAGVSGEVAQNMAEILKEMAQNMQVIVITHLPQVAVAGKQHFKVYKTSDDEIETHVKNLTNQERIHEIAEMLEGKPPSESALKHAKHLLQSSL